MNDALRLKIVWAVVFMSCLGFIPALGNAQTAAIEIHVLQSMSLTDNQFLTGEKAGKPVHIAAEMRLHACIIADRRWTLGRASWAVSYEGVLRVCA